MNAIYYVLMAGVAVSIIGTMVGSIKAMSTKHPHRPLRVAFDSESMLEQQTDRRVTHLSFVGQDRRAQAVADMRKFG